MGRYRVAYEKDGMNDDESPYSPELRIAMAFAGRILGNSISGRPYFNHSPDYATVVFSGTEYELTDTQRKIIKALHTAAKGGTPALSERFLLDEAGVARSKLRDQFQDHCEKLLGSLIVKGKRRDTWRLADSVS